MSCNEMNLKRDELEQYASRRHYAAGMLLSL